MKAIRRMMQETHEEEDILQLVQPLAPDVRYIGAVNWIGMWTLTAKEVHRFIKIAGQTILSPLVMTLLFYAVFAMGMDNGHKIATVPFLHFIIPGLIMMSMAQSAFMNTASSLILSKLQGNIVDILMPPLSPLEMTIGYAASGLVRGLLVGAVTFSVLWFFSPIPIHSIPHILYFAIMGSMMLSLIGVITGIWGDKFDHMGSIQNFIIMPATFLSGTFFSVASLPEKWQFACFVNPFFAMIDGFRYGFIGVSDGPLLGGMALLFLVNLALFNTAYWMFARGTCLKN
ncbi:MAG: ABC transporter permease [Alphaproteobacteria bacterium]|nr:ABC transporter permease [Alphaproteobacteria bacterium]